MKNKKPTEQIDEEDKDGGDKGGSSGSGAAGFIPSFDELIALSPEEAEIARMAKDGVFAQRVDLKSQGHKVAALDKKQEMRKRLDNPNIGPQQESGGSNLESHPELPEMAGVFDDIVFPESEIEAQASNDPDLSLKQQLKNRLGMGLSMQTLREEIKNKEKLRARPKIAPDATPQYVIRPAAPPPKPRPF